MSSHLHKQEIETSVGALSKHDRFIFACSIVDRLAPNYYAFAVDSNLSRVADTFENAIGQCWQLASTDAGKRNLLSLGPSVEEIIPDSEDYDSFYTGCAQYAALGLLGLIKLDTESAEHTLVIAQMAVDSAWELTSRVSGELNRMPEQAWLDNAPLVLQEKRVQDEDLSYLQSTANCSRDLRMIIKRNLDVGLQPFRRNLLKRC